MSDDKIREDKTIDSEDQATAALKRVLRSEYAPPMSESVIDVLLSLPHPFSPEEVEDMQNSFIEKRFADRYPKGVRHLEQKMPFERLLKATMKAAGMIPADIGQVISEDTSYVERVLNGEVALWEMKTESAARLIKLVRFHMDIVPQLVRASVAVRRGRDEMNKALKKALKKHGKRIVDEMKGQEGEDTELATDLLYASLADEIELSEEIQSKLNDLRSELERLGALDLLS